MSIILKELKSISLDALIWALDRKLLILTIAFGIWFAVIASWFLFGFAIFACIVIMLGYAVNEDLKNAEIKRNLKLEELHEQNMEDQRAELRRLELELEYLEIKENLAVIEEEEAETRRLADLNRKHPRRPHQYGFRKDRYRPLPPYMAPLVSELPIKGGGRKVAGIFYQRSKFKKLLGPIPEGATSNQMDTQALLVTAPDNPYDEKAIAVFVQGQHIGYLPADRAEIWAGTLDVLEGQGFHLEVPINIKQVTTPRPGPRAAIKVPDHDLFINSAQYSGLFDDHETEDDNPTEMAE